MKIINIADERQRNARVSMAHKRSSVPYRYVDDQQHAVESVRVVKNKLATDLTNLTVDSSLEDLSQRLIDGDPEIDMELFGKRVHDTSRIYLNSKNEPASAVNTKELFFDPNGELIEERALLTVEPNINTDAPLGWSGKLIPKKECYRKFVFVNAFQIRHNDGLTYDFLFSMAKNLEEQNAMMLVGAGKKANQPLVLSRNGKQYRAFLEGRTQEKKYQLILRLTNMELKPLPQKDN